MVQREPNYQCLMNLVGKQLLDIVLLWNWWGLCSLSCARTRQIRMEADVSMSSSLSCSRQYNTVYFDWGCTVWHAYFFEDRKPSVSGASHQAWGIVPLKVCIYISHRCSWRRRWEFHRKLPRNKNAQCLHETIKSLQEGLLGLSSRFCR